jgi:molecular chaperone GrpE (heat shock protein)
MIDSTDDFNKLSEEELDEKIQDVLKKVNIAYSMGNSEVLDQLLFHLDNLKMALGDKLEKQRFEVIEGKIPEQFSLTDDNLDEDIKE